MNRILAFRPMVATLLFCALALLLLVAAAPSNTATTTQAQRPVAVKPPVVVAISSAKIVDAKFTCGSTSATNFIGTVKNSSTKQLVFVGTLTVTKPGACLKTDPTRNPDGTPCTANQMFCPGYCTQYAPDTTFSPTLAPKTIAAGATATISGTVPNQAMKSAVFKVVEQGKTAGVTKKLGAFSPCIF
ncbi:MAG: hypothetical protein WC538_02960 [Thermoanaerobaculia bacterium]